MSELKKKYAKKVAASIASELSPEARHAANKKMGNQRSAGGIGGDAGDNELSELTGQSHIERAASRGADFLQGLPDSRDKRHAYTDTGRKNVRKEMNARHNVKEPSRNPGFNQDASRTDYDTVY